MWSVAGIVAAATTAGVWAAPQGVPDELVEVYDGFYIGEVVPTPKQARYFDDYVLLASADGQPRAAIVVSQDAPRQVRLAAAEISAQVGFRLGRQETTFTLPVVTTLPPRENVIAVGVVDSGAVQQAMRAAGLKLPQALQPEGYWVAGAQEAGRWIVLVAGADPLGAYHGAQSLLQLITSRNGQAVLRRAEILDWPDFHIRAHQFDGGFPRPERARYALKWCAKLKLNQLGFGQAYDSPMQWRELTAEQKESIEYLCGRAAAGGVVRACFYPHPHRSRPEFNIRISDQRDIDALVNVCSYALERGAGGIMLRSDDIWPLAEEDQKRFGDHAAAHIYLVNELYKRLRARWPEMVFMFCPPHYTNAAIRGREGGVDYIRRLGQGIPEDVLVIWTGPVTRSLEIKPEDVDFIAGLLGRPLLLWDNTVYAHRSRYGYDTRHPNYFLDTFATSYPADFHQRAAGITYNWAVTNPVALVAGIQTADCTWNLAGYDAEQSLKRAIAMVFGPSAVEDILALREAYYEVFDAVTSGRTLSEAEAVVAAHQRAEQLLQRLSSRLPKAGYASLEGAVTGLGRMAAAARQAVDRITAARKTLLADLAPDEGRWNVETEGRWNVSTAGRTVEISYPWGTPSKQGDHGTASQTVKVPRSPTGRYYLVFSCWDDYAKSGTPPTAWPGYIFKQALVNGEVVWEDDVEGKEPDDAVGACVVDVTSLLAGRESVTVGFRGICKRPVSNMGARIVFGRPMIVAGPARLACVRAEVPNAASLNPGRALTVWVDFELAELGRRQAIFDKGLPHQYFGFVHEDGHVVGGVFIGAAECGVSGSTKLTPGRHTVALIYDGSEVRLYVDGKLDGVRRAAGDVDTGSGNLHLGQYSGGSMPIAGNIAAAGVWLSVLDESALGLLASGQLVREGIAGFWRISEAAWTVAPELGDAPACSVYRIYEFAEKQ
ncbi:MAG: beta-N-acetylglucosaminidase domain-containing protein [Armatimonadetes bacterium]|nr:beta-N-acetylglucosaminidase domain-containing protein [Armatimonadota bacterium]